VVLELVGIHAVIADADLVLTAEGRLDEQTASGKAPAAVAAAARAAGVPCIGVGGSVSADRQALHDAGLDAVFALCDGPMPLERAMADARRLLSAASEEAVRAFLAGSGGRRAPPSLVSGRTGE
jgi:glycerate kinase